MLDAQYGFTFELPLIIRYGLGGKSSAGARACRAEGTERCWPGVLFAACPSVTPWKRQAVFVVLQTQRELPFAIAFPQPR